jgi:hypothetical protein
MGYQDTYRVLAEKIKRVMAAVDLAEVSRDEIDSFLDAVEVEPFEEEMVRRILGKAAIHLRRPGKYSAETKGSARLTKCRPSCEQLEDRLPPSAFSFALSVRSLEVVRSWAYEGQPENVAERASPSPIEIQAGEIAIVPGGEYGLAAATEPHAGLSAETFSSVFARSDYQLGPGFHGPGTPAEDLQEVLAWNLLSSHAGPGIAEAYAVAMAS